MRNKNVQYLYIVLTNCINFFIVYITLIRSIISFRNRADKNVKLLLEKHLINWRAQLTKLLACKCFILSQDVYLHKTCRLITVKYRTYYIINGAIQSVHVSSVKLHLETSFLIYIATIIIWRTLIKELYLINKEAEKYSKLCIDRVNIR